MKIITVVAAVIRREGKVLLASRPASKPPLGWEFPGGKVEPGENFNAALRRELLEELGVDSVPADRLYKVVTRNAEREIRLHFIRTLLRLYNGVFTEFRQIDEGEIATWSGYTVERVKELLKRLWQLRVIRYIPSNRSPILFLNEERLPRADLYIAPETYKRRQELMRERFEHMLAYAANDKLSQAYE